MLGLLSRYTQTECILLNVYSVYDHLNPPNFPSYLSILVFLAIRDLKSEIYMMQHCPPSPSQFVACVEHKAFTVTSGVTCGNHKASKGRLFQNQTILCPNENIPRGKNTTPFSWTRMVW